MIVARIRVNRNEEVGLRFVGDGGALLERNERIVLARVDHFSARQLLLDQATQAQRNIETQILFHQPVWPDRAGVVTAVARIDHDAADF